MENQKKILLKDLENSGNYLFHGSPEKISLFEPRQAYSFENGENIPDDKPGIHATPVYELAAFMALVNRKNCPAGSCSRFNNNDGKVVFQATKETLDQLTNPSGFIYIFPKDHFLQRDKIEYIRYEPIKPTLVISVGITELPEIEIMEKE